MTKLLLAISVIFMSCTLIVHSVFVYEMNAIQTLVAEEEAHDDKPSGKKFDQKVKSTQYNLHAFLSSLLSSLCLANNNLVLPKGFAEKPYLPPDIV